MCVCVRVCVCVCARVRARARARLCMHTPAQSVCAYSHSYARVVCLLRKMYTCAHILWKQGNDISDKSTVFPFGNGSHVETAVNVSGPEV